MPRRMFCCFLLACICVVCYVFCSGFPTQEPRYAVVNDNWVDVTIVEPCIVPSSIQCWEHRMAGVY